MSIIPLVFGEFFDDFFRPMFDSNFGFGISNDDYGRWRPLMRIRNQNGRPWRCQPHWKNTPVAVNSNKEEEFKVSFDVRQFNPENLSVKVIDNTVLVDGKHEERQDENSYVSCQFSRRYVLPEGVDPATVVSSLSSDGVLSITAPRKVEPLPSAGRVVPILHSQQPAIGSIQQQFQQQQQQQQSGEKTGAEKMEQ